MLACIGGGGREEHPRSQGKKRLLKLTVKLIRVLVGNYPDIELPPFFGWAVPPGTGGNSRHIFIVPGTADGGTAEKRKTV